MIQNGALWIGAFAILVISALSLWNASNTDAIWKSVEQNELAKPSSHLSLNLHRT